MSLKEFAQIVTRKSQSQNSNKPSNSSNQRNYIGLILLSSGAIVIIGVTLPLAVIKNCQFIQLIVDTPIGKGELTIKDKLDRF